MKIDKKESYKDGFLSVGRNDICCYACLNYKCNTDYECLIHGKINSLISSRCDEFENIILEDD